MGVGGKRGVFREERERGRERECVCMCVFRERCGDMGVF